jgi:SAM-dependent methyltransferase
VRLSEFGPDAPFDLIIAHGFFSWVPDEVKVGLMDFIGKHLTPDGTAVVSFNVVAGWKERMVVVEKARAIMTAGELDAMEALAILRTVAGTERELYLIDDMLAKGAAVLAHHAAKDSIPGITRGLSAGDVIKVAEVVRDLWRRERERGLSAGEKRMLAKARQILVSELALAEKTNEDKAEAILDEVLAS